MDGLTWMDKRTKWYPSANRVFIQLHNSTDFPHPLSRTRQTRRPRSADFPPSPPTSPPPAPSQLHRWIKGRSGIHLPIGFSYNYTTRLISPIPCPGPGGPGGGGLPISRRLQRLRRLSLCGAGPRPGYGGGGSGGGPPFSRRLQRLRLLRLRGVGAGPGSGAPLAFLGRWVQRRALSSKLRGVRPGNGPRSGGGGPRLLWRGTGVGAGPTELLGRSE